MTARICVVGAGVVGLSCAVQLAEAGFTVDVLTRERPEHTTSATAAAMWLPVRVTSSDPMAQWAIASLAHFREVAAGDDAERAGVRWLPGVIVSRLPDPEVPPWLELIHSQCPVTPVKQPAPGFRTGWQMTVPVIEPARYLRYLVDRLEALGGSVTKLALAALPPRGIVVNASGVAARGLVPDLALTAHGGQSVQMQGVSLSQWLVDLNAATGLPTYIVPQSEYVSVGATIEIGDFGRNPDQDHTALVVERAKALRPNLRDATVTRRQMGSRPMRAQVRLELENAEGVSVVHCYGHGYHGWATAWGSASAAVELVKQVAP